MKRALVFSGGGSRGAYEVGAWQALDELGIRFDAVYGTSIGAMNAALVAQGDLQTAIDLWANIDIHQVVVTEEEDFSIGQMVHNKRDVLPFLIENAKNLHMDVTPLIELVNRHLDEARVRTSGIDLGVMTVQIPQLQPVPKRLAEIPAGQLIDWVIASASCFPVFPSHRIGSHAYIDGGYFDNMPIDMALEDGADEVVAVDIHPVAVHPEYTRMPFIRLIHPLHDLGSFLDFDPRLLRRGRLLGYYDTMKAYDRFDGIRYTFLRRSDLDVAAQARTYMRSVTAFDAEAITRAAFRSSRETDAPLISAIQREDPLRMYSWKDVWVRGLELCAEVMDFREDAIYDPAILTGRLIEFCSNGEDVAGITERGIQTAAQAGRRTLVAYLMRGLSQSGRFPSAVVPLLAQKPAETAAALYLHTATAQASRP